MDHRLLVIDYYDRHPINETQILASLARRGKPLGTLTPEDLFDLDQDHYGGRQAVEALARGAGIAGESRVLDVCAGLGGPSRFLAWRYGCRVTGIDLTESRCRAATRLTRLVGLAHWVTCVRGDAMALPFASESFTAVVSQEGWQGAVCAGVLPRPGARWTARLHRLDRSMSSLPDSWRWAKSAGAASRPPSADPRNLTERTFNERPFDAGKAMW